MQWGDPAAETRRSRSARARRRSPRSSTAARGSAVRRAAGSGHVRAADRFRRRLSRRARQGRTAPRGSCTATAWSAPVATTTRTAAAAPSSTSSSGHAPRQLDRNVTLVGRVVQGMELLAVMPRGTAPMGFYDKPEQRVPIRADPRRRGRAGGAANRTGSAAHRHADVHGSDRGAAQPPGRVVQVSRRPHRRLQRAAAGENSPHRNLEAVPGEKNR